MIDHSEHWKDKWIEWWTKWPDGKFPRNTYAAAAKSNCKLGKATVDHYEGRFRAAEHIMKEREKMEIKSEEQTDIEKLREAIEVLRYATECMEQNLTGDSEMVEGLRATAQWSKAFLKVVKLIIK